MNTFVNTNTVASLEKAPLVLSLAQNNANNEEIITKTFEVDELLMYIPGITTQVLGKALTAVKTIGRSKVTTKQARLELLIADGVKTITIDSNGEVSATKTEASIIDTTFTANVIEATKQVVIEMVKEEEVNQVDLFVAAYDKAFSSVAIANVEVVDKSKNKYYFLSDFKACIRTADEFFALMARFDKELGTNLTSLMAEAMNKFGSKGVTRALKALNLYAVEGKNGRLIYPYRPVVQAIFDNFDISEFFVMGTRKQIFRPFVDLELELKQENHPSIGAFKSILSEIENTKESIEIAQTDGLIEEKARLEKELVELEKRAYTMPLTFIGGTKEDLFTSGSKKFTASAENGFTRCDTVEIVELSTLKETVYTNPLTGEEEVVSVPTYVNITHDLVDIQYVEHNDMNKYLLENVLQNGFTLIDSFGHEKEIKAEFLMASISKQRTLGATFCAVKPGMRPFETAVKIHESRGTSFLNYATKSVNENGEVVYSLKGETHFKRAALEAASSTLVPTIEFGKEIKYYKTGTWEEITREEGEALGVYDYVLHGGTHTMRVIKIEVKAVVKKGEYLVYDKKNEAIKKLNAAWGEKYWQKFIANDGANAFYSESIRRAIFLAFGIDIALLQGRWGNSGKGMGVYMPESEFITTLGDFVVFENNIKGNMEMNAECEGKLQFAICNYAKNPKVNGTMNMPYQFLNGYKDITVEDIKEIFVRNMARLEKALNNREDAIALVGANLDAYNDEVANLIDEGITDEEMEELLSNRHFTTVLKEALLKSQGVAFDDGYIKKQLWNFCKKLMRNWMVGAVEIQGEYKFALQDPMAVLDTLYGFWNGEIEGYTEDGEFFIDIPDHIGTIKHGEAMVIVASEDGTGVKMYEGHAVFQRNPQYANVEIGYAVCVKSSRYDAVLANSGLNNCVIYSHYDFNLIRQGRQDCDGDRSAFITEKYFVEYMKANHKLFPALLDITVYYNEDGSFYFKDGCPYENPITKDDVPAIPSDLVVSQDKFKVKFTAEQYENHELKYWLYQLEIAWALRNLKKNEIGLLTDRTTAILDCNSLIKECLKQDKNRWGVPFQLLEDKVAKGIEVDAESRRDFYRAQLAKNTLDTYKLRYAGGWEIDLPKKGGAYKDALRDTFLAFYFKNEETTPILSIENKKTGRRKVEGPLWHKLNGSCVTTEEIVAAYDEFYNDFSTPMAEEKSIKHRKRVKSVLDQHLAFAVETYKVFEKQAQAMLSGQNHIKAFLGSEDYNKANHDELVTVIKDSEKFFRDSSKNLMEKFRNEIDSAKNNALLSAKEKKEVIRELTKQRSKAFAELMDLCSLILESYEVIQNSSPLYVGYLAYTATNTEKRISSYAYTIAWKYFSQTLEYCANNKAVANREYSYKSLMKSDGRGGRNSYKFSFVVTDEVRLTREQITQGISAYNKIISGNALLVRRADNDANKLDVLSYSMKEGKYVLVGRVVYKDQLELLNGMQEAYLKIDATASVWASGKDTVNVMVTEMKFK